MERYTESPLEGVEEKDGKVEWANLFPHVAIELFSCVLEYNNIAPEGGWSLRYVSQVELWIGHTLPQKDLFFSLLSEFITSIVV